MSVSQTLTAEDLAHLLKVSKRTLYRWVQQGLLPAPLRVGATTRWRSDEVEKAMERWRQAR
ncbi:MAG: helix-turn-helix domain-containing protein [Planctomycetota bacterium]